MLPLPQAPDAQPNDYRTLEFYYSGSVQGYVVDEVRPGCGTIDLKINNDHVVDYRVRVMEIQDGDTDAFKQELDDLKAWGLEQECTIPALVGHSPMPTTRKYLLHRTPMVIDILERMDVNGMRRRLQEASSLLQKADPFHDRNPPGGKRARLAAFVRKPNGDIIKWPIHNNQIGVIVD